MSKDTIVGIGMAILIVSGMICAFQMSQLPPGTPVFPAVIMNPFGIIALIGLIMTFVGVIKND